MPLPHYPPAFWLAATAAVILVGLAKAGFGGGPVLLATPLLALTIPIAEATALLLPLLILADFLALRHYRREFDSASLRIQLPSALVGIVLGGVFFGLFSSNERILQIGIGVLALFFVLFRIGQTLIYGAVEGRRFPRPIGLLIGTTAGFTSTLVHAGGPLVTMYLLPQRLPRNVFVGTTVITFIIINVTKLLPYALLGLLRVGDLATILILSPLVYVGVRFGLYINHRVTERWFNAVIYFFLLLAAIQLISGRSIISLIFG